jgi:hypothetical protein
MYQKLSFVFYRFLYTDVVLFRNLLIVNHLKFPVVLVRGGWSNDVTTILSYVPLRADWPPIISNL